MRRFTSALLVGTCLILVLPAAVAGATRDGCRAEASSFAAIEIGRQWEPGDPVPAANDEWWALTVSGFAAEGLTLEQAAALFGAPSVAALYESINLGIRSWDKNENGIVCFKRFPPHQKGSVAYLFNVVDDHP